MNLFGNGIGALSRRDADVAQALADVATIGILNERLIHQSHLVAEQLQRALDTRILVEQAKGVLAQAGGLDVDEAFRDTAQLRPRSQPGAAHGRRGGRQSPDRRARVERRAIARMMMGAPTRLGITQKLQVGSRFQTGKNGPLST